MATHDYHGFIASGDAVQYRRSSHDSWSYARLDHVEANFRYVLKDGVQTIMIPLDMFPENLRLMEDYRDPTNGEKAEILRYFGYPWTFYWLNWKNSLKEKMRVMGKVMWRGQAYPEHKLPPCPQTMPLENKEVGSESDQPEVPTLFTGKCPPGTKDDGGKETFRYMPFKALAEVNKVLAYGAHKYAESNWVHVEDGKMRYWDAAMRHLTAWKEEGPRDTGPKGSGLRHLAHAATCCLFAIWFEMQEESKENKNNG